jgi:hypothetical protein
VSLTIESIQVIENEDEITKDLVERKNSEIDADSLGEGSMGSVDVPDDMKLEKRVTRTSSRRDISQSDSASAEQADPVAPAPRTRQDFRRNVRSSKDTRMSSIHSSLINLKCLT